MSPYTSFVLPDHVGPVGVGFRWEEVLDTVIQATTCPISCAVCRLGFKTPHSDKRQLSDMGVGVSPPSSRCGKERGITWLLQQPECQLPNVAMVLLSDLSLFPPPGQGSLQMRWKCDSLHSDRGRRM